MLWRIENSGQSVESLIWYVHRHEVVDTQIQDEMAPIVRKVQSNSYWGPAPNLAFTKGKAIEPPQPLPTIPEHRLLSLIPPPASILQYLRCDRKLSTEAIAYWELGYSRRTRRVVVPIRSRDGRLVGMSGRSLQENPRAKYLHSRNFKRDRVLYGEDKVVAGTTGYLHEGFFSCIYAWQFGFPNCVARMGTHLSGYQEDRLVEWFSDLVIVPDGDKAGMDSAAEIYERLRHRIPTKVAPMPFGSEVDRLSETDLRKVLGCIESGIDTAVSAH